MINNPWLGFSNLDLPSTRRVLPCDEAGVSALVGWCAHQPDERHKYRPQVRIYPDPFIGRLNAPVVIVMANPGYTDDARAAKHGCEHGDDWWHEHSEKLRECYLVNYGQDYDRLQDYKHLEYPLFHLDPELAASPGGAYYRNNFLKVLLKHKRFDGEDAAKKLANAILVIQFYPYHSLKFLPEDGFLPQFKVASQAFSLALVQKAIERKAKIFVMRCRTRLKREIPSLRDYEYIIAANPRSAALSSENLLISPRKDVVIDSLVDIIENSP